MTRVSMKLPKPQIEKSGVLHDAGQVTGLHDLLKGATGCGERKADRVNDWLVGRNGAMAGKRTAFATDAV